MEGFVAVISKSLKKGDEVSLVGFGAFTKSKRRLDDDSDGDGIDDDCNKVGSDGMDQDCDDDVDVEFTISKDVLVNGSSTVYANYLNQFYTSLAMDVADMHASPPLYTGDTKEKENPLYQTERMHQGDKHQGEATPYDGSTLYESKRTHAENPLFEQDGNQGQNPLYDANKFLMTGMCLMNHFTKLLQSNDLDPKLLLVKEKREEYYKSMQKLNDAIRSSCQVDVSLGFDALLVQAEEYDQQSSSESESMDVIYRQVSEAAPGNKRGDKPSPQVVKQVLDAFSAIIVGRLNANDAFRAGDFGSFSVSKRAARTGRNPQTGKEIKIAAKKVAKFKAGKALADTVK